MLRFEDRYDKICQVIIMLTLTFQMRSCFDDFSAKKCVGFVEAGKHFYKKKSAEQNQKQMF